MEKEKLQNIYNSLVYNELRILSSPELQKKAWINGSDQIACTFVDVVSGFLEEVEILILHHENLPKCIRTNVSYIKELYDKISEFYSDIIYNHSEMEVENIMNENRWNIIQKDALSLYSSLQKETNYH